MSEHDLVTLCWLRIALDHRGHLVSGRICGSQIFLFTLLSWGAIQAMVVPNNA